ncbi:unnamed protein product [Mycena citricolor]|uniref:Uncharacterized protein n=1 Tax=Mycena citricolor TaxID=2018698 RepID=A0AAD2HLE9_9AGAR|nr:unnamed protein product [Mycena citricolor]
MLISHISIPGAQSQSPSLATLCTATIVADLATCYDCIVAQSNGVLTADTAQLAVNAFVQSCQLQGIALSSATVSGASLAGTGLPDTTDLSGTGFAGSTTSVSSTIDSTPVVVPTLAQSTTGVTSQTSSFPPSSTSGSTSPATIPGLKGGASSLTISRCTFGFAGSLGLFLVI